jgi:hypothetical protein
MAKPFAWSYSRLKNFEVCPKRHYEIDLAKNYVEAVEPGSPLDWGERVHKALAAACDKGTPLPSEMTDYQRWVDRVRAGPGKLYTEQKYAITKDFTPTAFFANNVWYRGIGDIVRVDGPVALVLDWKTGKLVVDSVQLMLMAQCIFSHFPDVKKVRSEFVWLKDDVSTPEVYDRQDLLDHWVGLMNRVKLLENAHTKQEYPPKPGKMCRKWCPVVSCPHHGKGGY